MSKKKKEENKTKKELIRELVELRQEVVELKGGETTRKQEQVVEAQVQSEEMYKAIVENSPNLIVISQGNNIKYVNVTAAQKTGWSIEELTSDSFDTFKKVIPERYHERILRNIDKRLKNEFVHPYELFLKKKDGSEFPVELYGQQISYCGQAAIEFNLIDITEQKLAEEALKDSEERFRAIFENSPLGIILTDSFDHMFIDANPAFCRMMGYSKEELYTLNPEKITYPDDIEEDRKKFHQSRSQEEKSFSFSREKRYLKKNGEIVWTNMYGTLIKDQNGQPLYGLGVIEDITNRKVAEEALKNSEERLKILFDFAPDAYYLNDLKGTFLDGNKAAEKLVGYSKDHLIGKSFLKLNLLPAGQIPKAAAILAKNAMGLATGPDEFTLIRKDGTRIIVEIRTFSVKIKNRRQVLCIARDTTERKRIEEALKESEEKYRSLSNQLPVGVYRTTEEGKFLYANAALVSILGFKTYEELSKISVKDIFADPNVRINQLKEWEKRKSIVSNEVRFVTKDGKNIWLRDTGKAIFDDEDKILYFDGIIEDINDRKRAEMAQSMIYRMSEEVRTSDNLEDVLRKIHIELGAIMDAKNFHVTLYDERTNKYVFPYHVDEFDEDADFSASEPVSFEKSITDYVRRTGKAMLVTEEIEKELSKKDEIILIGKQCQIWMGTPLKGREDNTIGVMVLQNYEEKNAYNEKDLELLEIISSSLGVLIEKRKMEEEKRILEEQLRQAQKMEAIGTLAGGFAHHFNNMLCVIIGYTELAIKGLPEDDMIQENLKRVMKSSERAKKMVEQILAFSKKSQQTMKPVSVGKIIAERVIFLRSSIPPTIEIDSYVEENIGLVFANETQINQVIMNLCANAEHAMSDAGGTLKISLKKTDLDLEAARLKGVEPGSYLQLTVSDTACGMSKDIMNRIFEPYFTTKEVGEGDGLGLALVHGIVESHGGGITVESELGHGSDFHVFFPVIKE